MNKEEILEKSRKENKNRDIAELDVLQKASKFAYIVGCCVCMVICFVQWCTTETINWGCWVVNFSTLGTVFLVKFIILKRKHELLWMIVDYLICAFFLTGFIMSVRG